MIYAPLILDQCFTKTFEPTCTLWYAYTHIHIWICRSIKSENNTYSYYVWCTLLFSLLFISLNVFWNPLNSFQVPLLGHNPLSYFIPIVCLVEWSLNVSSYNLFFPPSLNPIVLDPGVTILKLIPETYI